MDNTAALSPDSNQDISNMTEFVEDIKFQAGATVYEIDEPSKTTYSLQTKPTKQINTWKLAFDNKPTIISVTGNQIIFQNPQIYKLNIETFMTVYLEDILRLRESKIQDR